MLIARWFSVADWECLLDDGIRDYSPADIVELPAMAVVTDLDQAKRFIESELDETEEEWRDHGRKPTLGWETEGNWHYLVDIHKKPADCVRWTDRTYVVLLLTDPKTITIPVAPDPASTFGA